MAAASADDIVFDHHDPADEPRRESLMGLGNGVLFVRACAPEAAFAQNGPAPENATHYPGLYLAGAYNRAEREINGERVHISALVNLPDPFALSFRIAGDAWFSLEGCELLHYRHRLDMAAGLAERDVTLRDAAGRETRLRETRGTSLVDANRAWLHWHVTPLNWSAPVQVRALLRTSACNTRLTRTRAYEGRHLDVEPVATDEGVAVLARTIDGTRCIRVESRLQCAGASADAAEPDPTALVQQQTLGAQAGRAFDIELQVRVLADGEAPTAAAPTGHAALAAAQREAWHTLWQHAHIEAPGDDALERACRFSAFHLLQTGSPLSASRDAGLPARGWQEGYFGQVFWDEVFAFGFHDLRFPAIARGLLCYRHRRLPAARRAAAAAGRRGAMFPWRSAASGEEETPPYQWIPPARQWKPDHTHLQHHIGSAIAFNLWRHHLATDDRALLLAHTGEMLIEIARFWASSVVRGESGRFEIRGVIGPDEYHDAWPGAAQPGLDNNAYTNLMAAWTLRCASELPQRLHSDDWRQLCRQSGVQGDEVQAWDDISRRLKVPLIDDGVIAQFDGFDQLLPADGDGLPPRHGSEREDWWLLARGDDVNRYQVTKQADVLMLLYLLGADETRLLIERQGVELPPGWHERTVRYYLERISHESSLSHPVCAGALAEIDPEESWLYFRRALHTDLDRKTSPSTQEGVHLGAMAGAWDVLQRFYFGLSVQADRLLLRPCPPAALDDVQMRVQVRGQRLLLRLAGRTLTLQHEGGGEGLAIEHRGESLRLEAGGALSLVVR